MGINDRKRSARADHLLTFVETAAGSGVFEVDPRVRVEEVRQRADVAPGAATLLVLLDDTFDGVAARRHYHPDRRIRVTTDLPHGASREILFEGYAPLHAARWDGRIDREEESFRFEADHVFDRWSQSAEAQVYGRFARNGEIEDGLQSDPGTYASRNVHVSALTCVFNPDGLPNRALTPLTIPMPGGDVRDVHPFTYEEDADARPWTYASILRYLLYFHLAGHAPIDTAAVYDATDGLIETNAEPAGELARRLAREPVSLSCEATTLAEALDLVLASAGVQMRIAHGQVGDHARMAVQLWVGEEGRAQVIQLARGGRHTDGTPRYDTRDRSAAQVLLENNAHRLDVTWDERDRITSPVIIGGIKHYEMTLPLWPGWAPRTDLDNVNSQDRAAAKSEALLPSDLKALGDLASGAMWFRRYHRQGDLFAAHGDVARLWVLNEDGRFDGALYNRHAPFDDYQPFDFATVAEASVTRAGAWMRRTRRLLPLVSTSPEGRSLGVWVEVSFDGGATWQPQSGGVRVLQDRAGIYFDVENPTGITPEGYEPAEQNLWYALVDQTFRVRVTATVESDERIVASVEGTSERSRLATVGSVVRRTSSFHFHSREGTTHALRDITLAGEEARDDRSAALALVSRLAMAGQAWEVRGLPAIPWIETGYRLGDRVSEVRGQYLRLNTSGGACPAYPVVLERRFVLHGDAYETVLLLGQAAQADPFAS